MTKDTKKRKHPLAHLKLYNERNLVVESDSEEVEEKNRNLRDVEHEGLLDVEKLLEHFDKEELKKGSHMALCRALFGSS